MLVLYRSTLRFLTRLAFFTGCFKGFFRPVKNRKLSTLSGAWFEQLHDSYVAYNFEQVPSSANSGKDFVVDCLNAHAYIEEARPQSLVWSKKHMKKTYMCIYIYIYICIYIYIYIYMYVCVCVCLKNGCSVRRRTLGTVLERGLLLPLLGTSRCPGPTSYSLSLDAKQGQILP